MFDLISREKFVVVLLVGGGGCDLAALVADWKVV